jgi:hypothetical protein
LPRQASSRDFCTYKGGVISLDRLDDVEERNPVGWASQAESAVAPLNGFDESRPGQKLERFREVIGRHLMELGKCSRRHHVSLGS